MAAVLLTSAEGAANVAVEVDVLAFGLVEEIAAVGTEDKGADGSHFEPCRRCQVVLRMLIVGGEFKFPNSAAVSDRVEGQRPGTLSANLLCKVP
jgi:hypothetical protein